MPRDTITLFMWGFQALFRSSLEWDLQKSLEVLGVTVEPTVFLIGLLKEDGQGHPLCVEPEDGPIVPADFDGLHDRATQLYHQNPDSQVEFGAEWIHERKHQEFRHRAYGTAISEVLEAKLGRRFFASLPAPVDQHLVFTVVGLPEWVINDTPHLKTETTVGRYRVTRSLVQGTVDGILEASTRALYQPNAGADIGISVASADVTKAAASALTVSVVLLAGGVASSLFDALNAVATTRYERRVGIGSLLLALRDSQYVDPSVTLRQPVRIGEIRRFRKLLETSSPDGESLLTDGEQIYGLGRLRAGYPEESEEVFQLLVTGDGAWELHHAGVALATVEFGVPRLPKQQLQRKRFDYICSRVLGDYDGEALWALADGAKTAEHGTMLVISARAADEAERLVRQAIPLDPTKLENTLVPRVTGIDGAVLVDSSGYCHAIGVILDGTATSEGDPSRGARYNSAVKYLASNKGTPTVILLVSEDGMINLLPDFHSEGTSG